MKDEIVHNYWTKQVAQTSDFHKSEVLDYIVSKLGPFIADKKLRYILGQTKSTIDLDQLITKGKTIIFDFGKLIGDIDALKIISSVLMVKFLQVLRKRAGKESEKISLYFDEIAFWPSSSIVELLRESRRYKVDLTLTAGRISEIDKHFKRGLLKVGTLVSFRLSTEEAQIIAPEFHSSISVDNLCMLKKYHAYIKYLQDGNPISNSEPINLEKSEVASQILSVDELLKLKSELYQKYGTPFETVEQDIKSRIPSTPSPNK